MHIFNKASKGGSFMKRLITIIEKHIRLHIFFYFLAVLFFAIGIVSGSYTVKALSDPQKSELINYLKGFFQLLKNIDIDNNKLLIQSLFNNLKLIIPIWLLGLTIIGIPFILFILGFRGFILGFTLGFLIDELSSKGVLFIILTILPHNLFHVPGLIGIGVFAISFSSFLLKNRIKKQNIINKKNQIGTYTTIILIISLLLVLGSIIEAYITPSFMKLLIPNLI